MWLGDEESDIRISSGKDSCGRVGLKNLGSRKGEGEMGAHWLDSVIEKPMNSRGDESLRDKVKRGRRAGSSLSYHPSAQNEVTKK